MAGDWIKIEHITPDKPEVHQMADMLQIDPDSVVGKLFRMWIWADQQSISGNSLKVSDSFLNRLTSCTGFSNALRNVGWLNDRSDGLYLPNFDRHNGQTAKARALDSQRKKRERLSSELQPDKIRTYSGPEKRREEKSNDSLSNDKPARTKTVLSEEEWWLSLKEKFHGIDLELQKKRAQAWLLNHPQRAFTRKFFVNWLLRVDPPVNGVSTNGQKIIYNAI
jgi:hypothetical protein